MKDIIVKENPNHLKGEISFEERAKQLEAEARAEEMREKRKRYSAYKEFAQLNMEGTLNEKVMYELAESPAAMKLFWFIANHMDGYNALLASYKVFEEALNMSESTITRGIKKLREMGLLYIKKSGSANVYMLNPDIIWKSWATNMQYCEFPAKVILAKSEQIAIPKTELTNQRHKMITLKD